jgi:hypothetical protein
MPRILAALLITTAIDVVLASVHALALQGREISAADDETPASTPIPLTEKADEARNAPDQKVNAETAEAKFEPATGALKAAETALDSARSKMDKAKTDLTAAKQAAEGAIKQWQTALSKVQEKLKAVQEEVKQSANKQAAEEAVKQWQTALSKVQEKLKAVQEEVKQSAEVTKKVLKKLEIATPEPCDTEKPPSCCPRCHKPWIDPTALFCDPPNTWQYHEVPVSPWPTDPFHVPVTPEPMQIQWMGPGPYACSPDCASPTIPHMRGCCHH